MSMVQYTEELYYQGCGIYKQNYIYLHFPDECGETFKNSIFGSSSRWDIDSIETYVESLQQLSVTSSCAQNALAWKTLAAARYTCGS
eukprot:scaffold781_cov132-Cylindrotheca_fusiformis.AAC.9